MDDALLQEVWQERKTLDRYIMNGARKLVWEEIEHRYSGFKRTPLKLQIPRAASIDLKFLKQQLKTAFTAKLQWPAYLVEWHIRNIAFSRVNTPSIKDIMENVNKPWNTPGRMPL